MALYYDIDDILMEDEIISVVFQVDANGVGMLDTGVETNKVEQGTKVEVPFWLAYELYIRNAVTVIVPPGFNQKTRKEIQADVGCVNLKSRCSYFDELGCKIAPMIGDRTMGSFLLYAFIVYKAARSSMTAFKKWRVGGAGFERASILKKKRSLLTRYIPECIHIQNIPRVLRTLMLEA